MTVIGSALALVACDAPAAVPSPVNPDIASAQAAMDAAAAAYTACVDKAAQAIDLSLDQPPALANRVLKSCIDARAELVDRAADVRRLEAPSTAALVAERSVRVADDELRDRANTTIVERKLKAS